MILGIFLSLGESLSLMKKGGQLDRFLNLYLKEYSKNFKKVYIFTYADETYNLPKNVILVPNKYKLHRYLYGFLMPLINSNVVKKCDVIRVFSLTGVIPSLLVSKPVAFNWAYDYTKFAAVEKKYYLIPLYYLLEKLAFFKSKIVLVATKSKIKKLKADKFHYLPNGVNLKLFKNTSTNKSGLIFIGRLERQKNLFFLLSALSLLPKKYKTVTFVGDGSLRNALINYSKKVRVNLKITKPIENKKLPRILEKYSIILLPSLHEGSPKILLEAMAMGLTPLVTNFPTAKDVIENNHDGLISSYNKKEFADKAKYLLENKSDRKKLSKNSQIKIKKQFDLELLLMKEIKILKEAASAS